MTSRLPPQPPPANQRLYNQQTYNGFVLTIDGHLVYSPFTDVDPSNTLPGGGGVANWAISNQGFFYNTTRGTTIDRTGSFVKIYRQSNNEPIATAIILNANFAANTIQIKVIRYEFEKDVFDLDPSLVPLKLRMEDNWKFCSNIPDWIPAGAESLSRWIPIMSSELEPSLGQKLNLKGGVTSVDGLSVPLVLDTSYQDDNRLQRLFTEDAVTYQYNQNLLGLSGVDNVVENNLTVQQTLISVVDLGFPVSSVPDYAGQYLTYYPFLNPSGLELALPEPWFVDTEAIIATTRTGGIVPPPPALPTFQYGVQRGIDDTPVTPHGKYSVIFRGMPFPIGQTCKLWEINNFNDRGNQDWLVSYRGMIENIALSDGLAACSIEISSVTFTARVNAGFATQSTSVERRKSPERAPKSVEYFNTFIATQPSFQDTFFWVKIGEIALPIIRVGPINYLAARNQAITQDEYFDLYGLLPEEIVNRSIRDLDSGTTDVGYKIGLEDAFGVFYYVFKLYDRDFISYNSSSSAINILNWFRPDDNVRAGEPDLLPEKSPWGFYILDQLSDAQQHGDFVKIRDAESLITIRGQGGLGFSSAVRLRVCDYLSEEPASFIHLFQNFAKGYDESLLPEYARNFFYETEDRNNYYLQASVIDVILQILTSTGSGTADVDVPSGTYRQVAGINGAWDLIPREFGLGIPLEEIDLDSFSRTLRKRGGMQELTVSNIYMETGKDTPQKFLEEQILKPFFFALGTNAIGKVILVDVSDIVVGPGTITIPSLSFVRKNGSRTRVTLTYDAADLSDSFTYMWKETFRSNWDDPFFIRTLTASGTAAGAQTRQLNDGTFVTVKSKARLFQRIQASPIKYELRYPPVAAPPATRVAKALAPV